jgi:hypothetical protein
VIKLKNLLDEILTESEDYKGEHEAPDKESGAPLYNLSGVYPEDIYTLGAKHYGSDFPSDDEALSIIRYAKDRPNRIVLVYRAVPYNPTKEEQINVVLKLKADFLRRGKLPGGLPFGINKSNYFEWLNSKIQKIESSPEKPAEKHKINPGDWVSITKKYAVVHGQDNLLGKYKIVSKRVLAKHLFTDGGSIQEWGYDPS